MRKTAWQYHLEARRAKHPEILAALKIGLYKDKEIGKKFGMTKQAMGYFRKKFGLPIGKQGRPVAGQLPRHDEIVADIKSGMLCTKVAIKYGMPIHSVYYYREKYGLPARKRGPEKK